MHKIYSIIIYLYIILYKRFVKRPKNESVASPGHHNIPTKSKYFTSDLLSKIRGNPCASTGLRIRMPQTAVEIQDTHPFGVRWIGEIAASGKSDRPVLSQRLAGLDRDTGINEKGDSSSGRYFRFRSRWQSDIGFIISRSHHPALPPGSIRTIDPGYPWSKIHKIAIAQLQGDWTGHGLSETGLETGGAATSLCDVGSWGVTAILYFFSKWRPVPQRQEWRWPPDQPDVLLCAKKFGTPRAMQSITFKRSEEVVPETIELLKKDTYATWISYPSPKDHRSSTGLGQRRWHPWNSSSRTWSPQI